MMEGGKLLDLRIHEHVFVILGPHVWATRHDHGTTKLESAEVLKLVWVSHAKKDH